MPNKDHDLKKGAIIPYGGVDHKITAVHKSFDRLTVVAYEVKIKQEASE